MGVLLATFGKKIGLIVLNFILANPGQVLDIIKNATRKGKTEVTEAEWDALIAKAEIPAESFFE